METRLRNTTSVTSHVSVVIMINGLTIINNVDKL